MLLHVLTHVDTHHVLFIVKQVLRQCLGKLRLADAGWSKEQERSDRLGRILDSCFGTKNCFRDFRHAVILTDDSLVQFVTQCQDFSTLSLCQLCYRNTGPAGNNPLDLFLSHTLMYQAHILFVHALFLDLQLHLRQLAILQFSCFIQIIITLCQLDLFIHCFDLLTQRLQLFNGFLLVVPLCLLAVELITQLGKFLLKCFQTLTARLICFLFQSCLLNLHLHDLTTQLIQLSRKGIQLCLDQCTRLIDQVDCFIRQESVTDIPM